MAESKSNRPQFSIIIPTLNEGDYIGLLLTDLQKQLLKGFEVIVVDAESTDGTHEQIQTTKKGLDLNLISTKKKNVSYQRNTGAEAANGEFLIFMDADCRIEDDFLFKLKADMATYRHLLYMPAMLPEKKTTSHETYTALNNFNSEVSQILGRPFATSSTLIIEKNFFNFLGRYDDKMTIYEDQEIIQRAFRAGVSAKILKDIGVVFCFRRFEKEGVLDVYKKYFIASAYILLKGKIYENIVDYKMEGGAYHKITKEDTNKKYDEALKKAIVSVKRVLNTINAGLKKV